jgi:hypothetical protein
MVDSSRCWGGTDLRPQHEYDEAMRWVALGLNDCEISRMMKIPRKTIWDWRRSAGNEFGTRVTYVGQDLRERAWSRPIPCPICGSSCLDEVRYPYLLGLYLGDGCLSESKPGVFRLRITLDTRYPGIIESCRDAIANCIEGKKRHVGQSLKTGCVEIWAGWKHWPCVFPQHGPGPKHRRRIDLVSWQQRMVECHPHQLLRGLIHSDGWRGLNRVTSSKGVTYSYPRYQFENHSKDIREIFCWACDLVDVSWRRMTETSISIATRKDVQAMDEFIGPKT